MICNADVWSLSSLLKSEEVRLSDEQREFLLIKTGSAVKTKSFLHLHLGAPVRSSLVTTIIIKSALKTRLGFAWFEPQ